MPHRERGSVPRRCSTTVRERVPEFINVQVCLHNDIHHIIIISLHYIILGDRLGLGHIVGEFP